jgi:protein-disulfide isomerase
MKHKKQWYRRYWGLTIFGSLALAAIISSGLLGYAAAKIQQAENQKWENKLFMISTDDPFIGSPNAEVHIVEFADFQCPFSKKAKPIVADIIKTYGDKIHFIYRDFPLQNHPYSQKAAEAAECAQDQGKFWELHNKIFDNQKDLTDKDLKKYAFEVGMPDMVKFNKCFDSGKYEQEVKNDYSVAEKAGARGTPTFFINGEIIHGAVTKEELVGMIEKYLKK